MDPQSAGSHAGDFNPRPYALTNVLGPQPTQAKLDPDAVVCPTDLGKAEAGDSSSLPCHPGQSLYCICDRTLTSTPTVRSNIIPSRPAQPVVL
ncbi:hypothetical protein F5141DRAFT_1215566 [Pisolithus sp. B1]|nr:hypothetical protein F5141DRAFT_1215566 [Pisolithus sp. B1]